MGNNWQVRAGKGGVCDFKENYDFFFKWLCNKVMSCFLVKYNKENEMLDKFDADYFKMNLLLDGSICITDFNGKIYPCIGNLGGEPDEYYCPTIYTIANPILGSKQVKINEDGCVIYNTKVDRFSYCGNSIIFSGGLYDLISQTATLLSDNIISINCCQINSRVTAFFTADSESQAIAGEGVLRKMYAGKPYQILRQDLIQKLGVNPMNTAANGSNLTELVELHNYIIANFFQAIGVKSNNVMKRERLINSEIDSQNDYLKVSLLEILTSWQDGLDKVNELYGTDFTVELNPALLDELIEDSTSEEMVNGEAYVDEVNESNTENTEESNVQESNGNTEETGTGEDGNVGSGEETQEEKDIITDVEEKTEQVSELIDFINGNDNTTDGQYSNTTDESEVEISNEINKESDEKNDDEEVKEDE